MKTKLTKLAYVVGIVLAMTFIFPVTSMATNTCSNATTCSNGTLKQYGTVTHGGQTYKTVVIGSQTWMAENLNYKLKVDKGWDVCYKEEFPYCDTYGRLYDWATAMALPYDCNFKSCSGKIKVKHQGICPDGWHIPTSVEWDKLYRYVDGDRGTISPYSSQTAGKYLKSTRGWNDYNGKSGNGEDKFCFSALPGGGGFPTNMNFYYVGSSGFWWSASENPYGGGKLAYNQYMYSGDERAYGGITQQDAKENLLSVRCVKN